MKQQAQVPARAEEISVDILIVGAGFAGICMAIKLRQAGMSDFLVIERSDEIGGTWYENRYPGCACDIPSHLYSFSFDRNPAWSRMYAPQQEIEEYLKSCVQRHAIAPFIRLNTPLHEARWDEARGRWLVCAADDLTIHARVLVSGMGALHVPHYPEIPGIESFEGPAFHSAVWDSSVDLNGKRIGVIGTGASAIQFVPEIAPLAGKLTVFQRTPPWVMSKPDFAFGEGAKRRFRRLPGATLAFRTALFWRHEVVVLGFLGNRKMQETGEAMARKWLETNIADPQLRAKLTPAYRLGCKRVLMSNDYYAAFNRANVELVTTPIAEARADSIVTEDGAEREFDALIFGTGFHVAEPFRGTRIVGKDGVEIHDAWRSRAGAYLGITVAGYPNLFLLLGPNTGLGHNSVVLMIEAQVRYVMDCLRLMRSRGRPVIEVKLERQQSFLQEMRSRLAGTVWQTGGCTSWYQDHRTGENPVIWPGSVIAYRRRTRAARPGDFDLRSPSRAPARPTAGAQGLAETA